MYIFALYTNLQLINRCLPGGSVVRSQTLLSFRDFIHVFAHSLIIVILLAIGFLLAVGCFFKTSGLMVNCYVSLWRTIEVHWSPFSGGSSKS